MVKTPEVFDSNTTLYHDREDFALRSRFRRLTFGINPYAEKTISLRSHLRLIWNAYFSMIAGIRYGAYVELYCDRRTKNCLRILRRQKVINWNDPSKIDIVTRVANEKAVLDQIAAESGEKYIN